MRIPIGKRPKLQLVKGSEQRGISRNDNRFWELIPKNIMAHRKYAGAKYQEE